jgi:NTP pyrophosphatase (non-canonical NTP hydrolase)
MKVQIEFNNEQEKRTYWENQLNENERKITVPNSHYLAEQLIKNGGYITKNKHGKATITRLEILRFLEDYRIDYDMVGVTSVCEALYFDYNVSTLSHQTSFKELSGSVIDWARQRELLSPENAKSQYLKFIEESGELARGILKADATETEDAFGDVLVTLIILAEQLGYNLERCLQTAYNEIKSREGKTIDGTFIKN